MAKVSEAERAKENLNFDFIPAFMPSPVAYFQ